MTDADKIKLLRIALNKSIWVMTQPLDEWKGLCERIAMDSGRATLFATADPADDAILPLPTSMTGDIK